MFESLFKRKNIKDKNNNDVENLNKKENQEVYLVKDLYVAYPALVSYKNSNKCFVYNEGNISLEKIVVKKINEYYVNNILNDRKYGIFSKRKIKKIIKKTIKRLFILVMILFQKNMK